MAEYYLISQLPSLDGLNISNLLSGANASDGTQIPITEESFLDLCNRFLSKKSLQKMKALTLEPSIEFEKNEKINSRIIECWNNGERDLRLALAKARSEKMNKAFELGDRPLPSELCKIASTAVDLDDPLEAEKLLLQYRLTFLEGLRPMDNFSEEYVFYYALRLKLISRIKRFDTVVGETTYKNIYNSILNGERTEDKR